MDSPEALHPATRTAIAAIKVPNADERFALDLVMDSSNDVSPSRECSRRFSRDHVSALISSQLDYGPKLGDEA